MEEVVLPGILLVSYKLVDHGSMYVAHYGSQLV
jgi:hypothetical protein